MICLYTEQQDQEEAKVGNMELTEKFIQPGLVPFDKPKPSKPAKRPPRRKRESEVSRESEDLATHIEICALRYKGIEEKFEVMDKRLDHINEVLVDIQKALDKKSSTITVALITGGSTIIVALITFLGYLLTHIK